MTTTGRGGQIETTYRYRVRGPVQDPVTAELRRGHAVQNEQTEHQHAYEAAVAAAWDSDPVTGPAIAAAAEAEAAWLAAKDAGAAARQRAGYAQKRGRPAAEVAALKEHAAALRAEAALARAALVDAQRDLRAAKDERLPAIRRRIAAAKEARDAAIADTYETARDAGLHWGTWADITDHHKLAVRRMSRARAKGGPSQLRYRRWNGTGTVTVQVQRELGVTPSDRALVAALKAAGLTAGQVSDLVAAGVPAAEATGDRVTALRAAGLAPAEVTAALIAGMSPDAARTVMALAAGAGRAWDAARTQASAARERVAAAVAAKAPKEVLAVLRVAVRAAREEAADLKKAAALVRAEALEQALEQAAAAAGAREPGRSWAAQTIARMREDGPDKPPDPPCSPAVLASGRGKWASQVRLQPELPADFAVLPRTRRRALAREGRLAVRTGAGDAAAVTEMPVTVHRPMHPDADVKMVRLTVSRCGPDLEQHVSLAARIPLPGRRPGRPVAVHTGWRALEDGALRVAAVAGAGPVPAGVAATGVLRDHGWWQEVVIPARWRDEQGRIEKDGAARKAVFNAALAVTAGWLEVHPDADANLPSAGEVRAWRSPSRLVALGRRIAAGEHGDSAKPLGDVIAGWEREDRRAWRNESRSRRRLTRRRDDAWRKVAAWLCTEAGEVRVDAWEMPPLARRPAPGEDDDPQAAAARANRVLAAPGELRASVRNAARLLAVPVTGAAGDDDEEENAGSGDGAQLHWRCGAPLDPAARRRGIVVRCSCGAAVDQDENMLRLMLRD
jgi:hypothetical protein